MSDTDSTRIGLTVLMPVLDERHTVRAIVEKVLAMEGQAPIGRLQLVIVDDGSTDGSERILDELADAHPQIRLFHQENRGKGAAVRQAITAAEGDVCIVQDADLEYDPADYPRMLAPFVEDGADAVFGSRFAPADRRRVLLFWHKLGNRLLTLLCNFISDLDLSDMETCYKAVRTEILRRIPIRSDDFGIEPELTIKLAKKGCQIFEVPINYRGRTYLEGKKIGAWDGVKALWTMARFALEDDLHACDGPAAAFRRHRSLAPNYMRWKAETLAPHLGTRVLEVDAGDGQLSRQLFRRDRYVAAAWDEDDLVLLKNLAFGRPFLDVLAMDPDDPEALAPMGGAFDTVLSTNLLAHAKDDVAALKAMRDCLADGGRLVLLVPQGPERLCGLDETLGTRRRYDRETLRRVLEEAGFGAITLADFNRFGAAGWHLSGHRLGRKDPSWLQLKLFDGFTPLVRRVDELFRWPGLSLLAVAERD